MKKTLFGYLFLLNFLFCTQQVWARGEYFYKQEASDGAIIRKLIKDPHVDHREFWVKHSDYNIDLIMEYIEYQEKTNEYERANRSFDELCKLIDEMKNENKKQKSIKKVYKWLGDRVDFNPTSARVFYQRALFVEKFLGDESDNIKMLLKEAINLDKNNAYYLFELANFYISQNETDKALPILESLKKQYPKDVDFRIKLAEAYVKAGLYYDAIREYKVALNFAPTDEKILYALNDLYQYTNNQAYYVPSRNIPQTAATQNVVYNIKTDNNYPEKETPAVNKTPVVNKTSYTPKQNYNTAPARRNVQQFSPQPQSSKRVVVSYVNGKKVVKIVNIDANTTMQTVQDATNTFDTQLNQMNSVQTENKPEREEYTFKEE